jgi:hypothetical protein
MSRRFRRKERATFVAARHWEANNLEPRRWSLSTAALVIATGPEIYCGCAAIPAQHQQTNNTSCSAIAPSRCRKGRLLALLSSPALDTAGDGSPRAVDASHSQDDPTRYASGEHHPLCDSHRRVPVCPLLADAAFPAAC